VYTGDGYSVQFNILDEARTTDDDFAYSLTEMFLADSLENQLTDTVPEQVFRPVLLLGEPQLTDEEYEPPANQYFMVMDKELVKTDDRPAASRT